uniref:Arginyltransferase 1 n=1 Tax=Homo sapiens TaxID=9606 RepID=A0A8I5KXB4_HUMAN
MASVVEYKGLRAGYHCGYCDSKEGKASCVHKIPLQFTLGGRDSP